MGVRVKLRVRISDREVDVALVNSGFGTDSPQLLTTKPVEENTRQQEDQ